VVEREERKESGKKERERQIKNRPGYTILTDSFDDVGKENPVTHVSLQVLDQPLAARSAQVVVRPVGVNLHSKPACQLL
jgi:hypothetical protein